jgi:hypothetical protein
MVFGESHVVACRQTDGHLEGLVYAFRDIFVKLSDNEDLQIWSKACLVDTQISYTVTLLFFRVLSLWTFS